MRAFVRHLILATALGGLVGCVDTHGIEGIDAGIDAGADAAPTHDAAPSRDAARPSDTGHDAFAIDLGPPEIDAARPIDAGSGLPLPDTGSDAGCTATWCACSAWTDHIVSSAYPYVPWAHMGLAPSGVALVFLDGVDWLDASDAVIGARTPFGTPNRYVFGVASHPDALGVVLVGASGGHFAILDPATRTLRADVPFAPLDRTVGDYGAAAIASGFVVTWTASGVAHAQRVARDGTPSTAHALSPASAMVSEVVVADAAGALAALYTTPSDPHGVWWQRLDADGAPSGAPIALGTGLVPASASLTASGPQMIGDASGWFAVWAEERAGIPPPPFGPSTVGRYVIAHLAPDGALDLPPTDLDTSVYWFAPSAHLALDPLGRLALLVTTLVGDAGDALFEVHFLDRTGARWRPYLAAGTSTYQNDLVYDPATAGFVASYLHESSVGLWRICDP